MSIAVECIVSCTSRRVETNRRALHFGSARIPGSGNYVVIRGEDTAPHHGKIFCAQGE